MKIITILALLVFSNNLQALDADKVSPQFQLVDPETAPEAVRPLVMKGYQIMLETKKQLPEYAGDVLSCTNCHFSAGNTLGGINGGISLVGVAQKYPIHLDDQRLYTLAERINACFRKSLNGRPLPENSEAMKSLLAYFDWISKPVASLPDPAAVPWLGMKRIRIEHTMDPKAGSELYATHCALCHGADGQGQPREEHLSYPPLWGPHSFNDAAGMNQLPILASFIFQNMPYEDPALTMEQALDIAAFIINQPRPHDEKDAPQK